jgi:hypothetical protein
MARIADGDYIEIKTGTYAPQSNIKYKFVVSGGSNNTIHEMDVAPAEETKLDGGFFKLNGPSINTFSSSQVYTIMTDTNKDAAQEGDRHYSWKCSICFYKGTKWIHRKDSLKRCPNCDNTNPSTFRISQIADRGNCRSMWADTLNEEPPTSILKTIRCEHCGSNVRFLIKQPKRCTSCDRPLQ